MVDLCICYIGKYRHLCKLEILQKSLFFKDTRFVKTIVVESFTVACKTTDYNIFESAKSKQDRRREAERETTHPAQSPPLKDLPYKF